MNNAPSIATKEDAIAAIRRCAFHVTERESSDYGRRLIHSFAGPFGADWDEDDAIKYINESTRIEWVDHRMRHNLAVDGTDGVRFFDCKNTL